jgi:hypothetical protein
MSWSTLTSFPTAAGIFSASMTTLINGKILVSGGEAIDNSNIETLEPHCWLYNPSLDSWTQTGALHTLRVNSQTVTLNTGKILTVGGRASDIDAPGLDSCELYDVGLGTWAITGSLNESRYGYGIWILNSGDILVAGGNGGGGIGNTQRNSTELYSVSGGTWTNTGHNLPETLEWPYFFSLNDGTPIAAGGNNTAGTISVYKYNVSTGWSTVTTYPLTGFNDTSEEAWNRSMKLTTGKFLLAATNYSAANKFAPTTICFLYDPVGQTMTQCGSLHQARTYSFQLPLTQGGAYVASGLNPSLVDVHSVEQYNANTDTWTVTSDNPPTFISLASFAKSGNHWYQLGGEVNNGASAPTFLRFTEDLPDMATLNDINATSGVQNFHSKGTAGFVIEQGVSEPGSPILGQMFYRTDTHALEVYNGTIWVVIGGGGSSGLVQVVQATRTVRDTTTSTTFVDTSLTLSITPSSSAHRIKLSVSALLGNVTNQPVVTITRNGTDLGSNNYGFGGQLFGTDSGSGQFACNYVDSPATTSAITYTVRFRSDAGAAVYFGNLGATSVLIAEEITV